MKEDLNSIVRKLRIFSGLILFVYVFTHLLNHSVNILSIPAGDYVKETYFHFLWKNPIGTVLLYGSFLTHVPLGFYDLAKRKSFKISRKEWIQIIFPILGFFLYSITSHRLSLQLEFLKKKLPMNLAFRI